jgi:hypothetical protein
MPQERLAELQVGFNRRVEAGPFPVVLALLAVLTVMRA